MHFPQKPFYLGGVRLPLATATSRSANAVSGKQAKQTTVTLSCYATFARTCYECGLRVCTATKYLFSKQATSVICSTLSCLPLPPLRAQTPPATPAIINCKFAKKIPRVSQKLGEQAKLATNAPNIISSSQINPRVSQKLGSSRSERTTPAIINCKFAKKTASFAETR